MGFVLSELVEDAVYLTEVGVFAGEDYENAVRIPGLVHQGNCNCYHCVRYNGVTPLYNENFSHDGVYGYYCNSRVRHIIID